MEDTTSAKVLAWAPAYENFALTEANGTTEVTVSLDTVAEYEKYMMETYPKALALLKELCESRAGGH